MPALTQISTALGSGASSIDLSTTGLVTGDNYLIFFCPQEGVTDPVIWPAGATEITGSPFVNPIDSNDRVLIATGVITDPVPPNLTITHGTLGRTYLAVLFSLDQFSGFGANSQIGYDFGDPLQQTPQSPSVTALADGAQAIAWLHGGYVAPVPYALPATWGTLGDSDYTFVGTRQQTLWLAQKTITPAGATGLVTWDMTGFTGRSHAGTLIIEPESAASTTLIADSTNYSAAANDSNLYAARLLSADSHAVNSAYEIANLYIDRSLTADNAALIYGGVDVSLLYDAGYFLTADLAALNIIGESSLITDRKINADTNSIFTNTELANLLFGYSLSAEPTTSNLFALDILLSLNRVLVADSNVIELTGLNSTLLYSNAGLFRDINGLVTLISLTPKITIQ